MCAVGLWRLPVVAGVLTGALRSVPADIRTQDAVQGIFYLPLICMHSVGTRSMSCSRPDNKAGRPLHLRGSGGEGGSVSRCMLQIWHQVQLCSMVQSFSCPYSIPIRRPGDASRRLNLNSNTNLNLLHEQVAGGGELRLRTDDPRYLAQVDRWWAVLLPRMARHLYIRGGNVLMVQVRRPCARVFL